MLCIDAEFVVGILDYMEAVNPDIKTKEVVNEVREVVLDTKWIEV